MKKEHCLYFLLFVLLYTYLILRAIYLFPVHDEIVSKWSYMVDWNPLPYQGYIDANNQFLNSLLGGLFIRLFQSDQAFIIRLPSLLAFPFYFFAVLKFRKFFKKHFSFAFFFVAMLFNPFILEFFALARGYAMAWTFLIWCFLMLFKLLESKRSQYFFLLLLFAILSLYANLSLIIPVCLVVAIGSLFMLLQLKKSQKLSAPIGLIIWLLPFFYLIDYSLELQKIGKLYLGDSNSFYRTSIENLFNLSFDFGGIPALIISIIFLALICLQLFKQRKEKKWYFNTQSIFPFLFLTAVVGVILLQLILGINYPENRAAAYFYLLGMPAVAFAIDQLRIKYIAWPLSILTLFAFAVQYNLKDTKAYSHEYINFEILENIPAKVYGIPTVCGGRQLAGSKVIYRESNLPNPHFFQTALSEADTLQDYIMCLEEDRENITNFYDLIAKAEDSRMLLYKRKKFLKRTKVAGYEHTIASEDEFVNLIPKQASKAAFIRCKGYFEFVDLHHDPSIIYAQSDSSDNKFNYGGFTPLTFTKRAEDGKLHFDISLTFLDLKEADFMSLYVWNSKKQRMQANIEVSVYDVEF